MSPKRISERVIGCAMTVSNTLGTGFLESVYEKALYVELTEHGICFKSQVPYDVEYKDNRVGLYFADLVIEEVLLLELKATAKLNSQHDAQVMNYLKVSGLSVGILLNFGTPRLQLKRIVWNYDAELVI